MGSPPRHVTCVIGARLPGVFSFTAAGALETQMTSPVLIFIPPPSSYTLFTEIL